MDYLNNFKKIIEEKKENGLKRNRYGTRKLSIGLVSCALAGVMLFTPLTASAVGGVASSTGATTSVSGVNVTNKKQTVLDTHNIKEIVITPDDPNAKVSLDGVGTKTFESYKVLKFDKEKRIISGKAYTSFPNPSPGTDKEVFEIKVIVENSDGSIVTEMVEITVLYDIDGDGDPDITDPDDDGDGIPDVSDPEPKGNLIVPPRIYGQYIDSDGNPRDEIDLDDQVGIEGQEINVFGISTLDPSIIEHNINNLPPGIEYTGMSVYGEPKIEDWGKTEEKRVYDVLAYAVNSAGVRGENRFKFTVLRDTDRDGIPDTTDTDDDGDGFTDAEELAKGSDPKDPKSTPATIPAPSPSPSRPSNPSTSRPTSPVANDTATNRPETGRIDGRDRIETAINISKQAYNKAKTVIVVRHDLFPDSMTASVLAKLKDAPILLNPTDKLDSRVADEIKRLGAEEVIIVGGQNSVSENVREELKAYDADKNVERISGADRYGTSEMVAKRVVGITGKKNTGVVASGQVFPDALSVGTFASREGYPILLVKKDSVPSQIQNAIRDLDINKTYIAGGTNTISTSTEANLPNVVERMAGNTRYETSVAISKSKFGASKEAYIASGEEFADALVISPVSGKYNRPTLLVSTKEANNGPVRNYVKDSKISKLTAIGGQRYVPSSIIDGLVK